MRSIVLEILTLVFTGLLAGVTAFIVAYARRRGQDRAIEENFEEVLRQLKLQTKATEEIKDGFVKEQNSLAFLREQYAVIAIYSNEQALALRQAYLLLYEPDSSEDNVQGKRVWELEGKPLEALVDKAVGAVMDPLRKNIGQLDEPTSIKIYEVQDKLLGLKDKTPEERDKEKNRVLDATETARQFVQRDKIFVRLGLIDRTLEERRSDKE